MNRRLQDIIDIPLLQQILDSLNNIYPFPSAIIDNDGSVLAATAWQDICVKFHRANPESEKGCIQSDTYIASHLHEAAPAITYRCPHGLVDNAIPIVIEGKHLGNFFTGQFFLEKPDLEFFKQQARTYGYDEVAYLEAVARVPIWSQPQLAAYLGFLKSFTDALAGMGLRRLRELLSAEVIAEKERFINAILNVTPSIIYIYDIVDRRNIYANDGIQRLLGYTTSDLQELGDQLVATLMHQEDFKIYLAETYPKYSRLKDGQTLYHEYRMRHKSGGWRWLSCSEVIYERLPDGTPRRILGVVLDISERHLAHETMRASELLFRSLFENMTEGVALHELVYDGEGMPADYRIVDVNGAFTAFTGIPAETARGTLASVLYGTGSPPYLHEYSEVVRTNIPHFFETFFPPLGKYFSISAISPKPGSFATIFLDITDRKNAEINLKRLNDELETRVKERTAELEKKVVEIERMNNLFVDRELAMVELKKKIRDLEGDAGRRES